MISFTQRGSFKNTERYLARLKSQQVFAVLSKYGAMGAQALAAATPTASGRTAASWTYSIVQRPGYYSIRWHNTNINEGELIAILIQYGHGTGTGGYVQGRDYVNPAIQPIFEAMANDAWEEVTKIQ